ncbi:hypothetical protein X798_04589 [Onchocerca flexuosa]|uniref:Uncharacterized protein n=1 Tax=Onchocerca flexuosa TaxID=387005 RepID=A0A238BSQ2_9BILA|nr:hypothetical protein X798_04589 [Onchocerca flexuosa]
MPHASKAIIEMGSKAHTRRRRHACVCRCTCMTLHACSYQSIFASECGFIPSLIRQEDQRYHNFSHNNNDDDDDEVYENWTFTGNH